MASSIKGVLFDMDGVLVDNMSAHIEAFDKLCVRHGIEEVGQQLYGLAGMSNDEIMRKLFPAELITEVGTDALALEKEAIYRELYAATIKPIEGLVELLKELNSKGIKCAVGSSGCKANVEFVLKGCGIEQYFSALVYSDLVTRCKPDPEIYLTAAKLLDLKPEECAVFEDAVAGVESARNAKVARVIALSTTLDESVLREQTTADEIITDYRQVMGREW